MLILPLAGLRAGYVSSPDMYTHYTPPGTPLPQLSACQGQCAPCWCTRARVHCAQTSVLSLAAYWAKGCSWPQGPELTASQSLGSQLTPAGRAGLQASCAEDGLLFTNLRRRLSPRESLSEGSSGYRDVSASHLYSRWLPPPAPPSDWPWGQFVSDSL